MGWPTGWRGPADSDQRRTGSDLVEQFARRGFWRRIELLAQHLLADAIVAQSFRAFPPQDADAHRRGGGVAAGVAIGTILGLGIAGAYAGPRYYDGPGCYAGPRHCDYVGRSCWFNRYGERICRGGEYRCWRERVCD